MDIDEYVDKRLVLQSIVRHKLLTRMSRQRPNEKPIPNEITLLILSRHPDLESHLPAHSLNPHHVDQIIENILQGHSSVLLRQLSRQAFWSATVFTTPYSMETGLGPNFLTSQATADVLSKIENLEFRAKIRTATELRLDSVLGLDSETSWPQIPRTIALEQSLPRLRTVQVSAAYRFFAEQASDEIPKRIFEDVQLIADEENWKDVVVAVRTVLQQQSSGVKKAVFKVLLVVQFEYSTDETRAVATTELLEGSVEDACRRIVNGMFQAIHESGRAQNERLQLERCMSD